MEYPYVLFKPDEEIYWICCYDSINKYFIMVYITKRYDDIRVIRGETLEQCSKICLCWKNELENNEWIQLDNQSKFILRIIKQKHISEAIKVRKNYSYEIFSHSRRQKIYNKYKIKKQCCA